MPRIRSAIQATTEKVRDTKCRSILVDLRAASFRSVWSRSWPASDTLKKMSFAKTIYVLIGPKGSGKTHIGNLLERAFNIAFLNVENLGLANIPESKLTGFDLLKEGFHQEEAEIDRILTATDAMSFESTGAADYFYVVLGRLRSQYDVKLLRIYSPLETCHQRVHDRDQTAHIPVSDALLRSINEKAAGVDLAWDLQIDNSKPMPESEILEKFRSRFKI